jgi:hypothetical protein
MTKKTVYFFALLIVAISIFSCNKDKDLTPPFSPVGFWRGNLYLYNIAVLNNENGKGRIFIGVNFYDTASALTKMDANYIEERSGGIYKLKYYADTSLVFVLESHTTSSRYMAGRAFMEGGSAADFELRKQ